MGRKRQAGQALVAVALGMVVMLGALGLGIDFGFLRYEKRSMQTAADSAAMAGAGELSVGDVTAAARIASSENGFTNGTGGVTVTVNNPPTTTGDPHNGDSNYVEVLVSKNQPTFFAGVFGVSSVPMTTRAEAAQGGGGNCIYTLSHNGGTPGLAVDLLASITSACGIVDENNSASTALQCGFFASITASSIGVVGTGVSDFLCTVTPSPTTGINSPGDPLASTTVPSIPGCGATRTSPFTGWPGSTAPAGGINRGLQITAAMGAVTLNPGNYCGGIDILPGANVTLTAGTYILSADPAPTGTTYGLTADLGTTVSGSGVTFYNSSGAIDFAFSGITATGINLTAPTSGTYEGILFFQPAANTAQAQIIGSPSFNTTLQGTYYFPGAKVVFAFDGPVQYDIIDAYQVEFAFLTFAGSSFSSSGFSNNYSTLANGSPIKGGTGVLVE